MSNGNNLIVTKVDLSDLARGSRGDFSNKFVRENFTQILVLQHTAMIGKIIKKLVNNKL